MFGFIKKRKPIILSQWYVPLLDFESNATEFYQAVETDLKTREVPGLHAERITFKEAGYLSANHEYLRLRRERTVLDVGSAKFGSSWWFSARAAILPRSLTNLEVILTLLGIGSFFLLYFQLFGLMLGGIVFGSTILFVFVAFWMARAWAGLDEFILWMPVIGQFYESFARRETYHRQDQRRMFASVVETIVRAKVCEYCSLGGVSEPEFHSLEKPEQILSDKALKKWAPWMTPE